MQIRKYTKRERDSAIDMVHLFLLLKEYCSIVVSQLIFPYVIV